MERTRANNSFVIFQFGDGSSENVVLNLPTVLIGSNGTNRATVSNSSASASASASTTSASSTATAVSSTGAGTAPTVAIPVSSTSTSTTASSTNPETNQPTVTQNNADNINEESTTNSTTTSASNESDVQRNMLLSVSYIYSQTTIGGLGGIPLATSATPNTTTATTPAASTTATTGATTPSTTTNTPEASTGNDTTRPRTGTLLLSVPDIPTNGSEAQFNAMVEFAASIALTAIAASSIRRNRGISKESFEKYPIKTLNCEVDDITCPICFDEYINVEPKVEKNETKINESGKRGRDDDDETKVEVPNKSRKTNNSSTDIEQGSSSSAQQQEFSSSTAANEEQSNTSSASQTSPTEPYTHIPVELPCSHTFGRSCLYEWLKSNSTCPLCRHVLRGDNQNYNPPERINLPNISSLLNSGTRDRPIIIVFDRSTNTLTTRNATSADDINTNATDAIANTILNTAPFRPFSSTNSDNTNPTTQSAATAAATTTGVSSALPGLINSSIASNGPLDPTSRPRTRPSLAAQRILSLLNGQRTHSVFSTGVMSRRTPTGVETVNVDNNPLSPNSFENFFDESRRLVLDRLNLRNNEATNDLTSETNSTSGNANGNTSNNTNTNNGTDALVNSTNTNDTRRSIREFFGGHGNDDVFSFHPLNYSPLLNPNRNTDESNNEIQSSNLTSEEATNNDPNNEERNTTNSNTDREGNPTESNNSNSQQQLGFE